MLKDPTSIPIAIRHFDGVGQGKHTQKSVKIVLTTYESLTQYLTTQLLIIVHKKSLIQYG
jgi:hypothetical protein